MTVRRLALALLVVGAAAGAGAAFAARTASVPRPNPCKGVRNCITVNGPWVAVPASGAATFLLECPKRNGYVAGIDTLASSSDVRASWNARLPAPPSPISKAATVITGPFILFTAYSAGGKQGLLQPWIGCVPVPPQNPRSTTSARVAAVAKPGAPVNLWQTTIPVHTGHQTASRGCGKGERLLGGWQATAFKGDNPAPALASKVHVTLAIGDGRVAVSVRTDAGIPLAAFPEVQVGATCAK
jgi:hypothetical protein